jgi:hypothetical protein
MGMQPCSQTFNPYFLKGGRIVNCYFEFVFTDRLFVGEFAVIEADYWVQFAAGEDVRFGTPYIAGSVDFLFDEVSGLHQECKTELTLRRWQVRNGLDPAEPLDPELWEALPTELRNQITEEQ